MSVLLFPFHFGYNKYVIFIHKNRCAGNTIYINVPKFKCKWYKDLTMRNTSVKMPFVTFLKGQLQFNFVCLFQLSCHVYLCWYVFNDHYLFKKCCHVNFINTYAWLEYVFYSLQVDSGVFWMAARYGIIGFSIKPRHEPILIRHVASRGCKDRENKSIRYLWSTRYCRPPGAHAPWI